jgi:hypothetical protein
LPLSSTPGAHDALPPGFYRQRHAIVVDIMQGNLRPELLDQPVKCALQIRIAAMLADLVPPAVTSGRNRHWLASGRNGVGDEPGGFSSLRFLDFLSLTFIFAFGRAVKAMTFDLEIELVVG